MTTTADRPGTPTPEDGRVRPTAAGRRPTRLHCRARGPSWPGARSPPGSPTARSWSAPCSPWRMIVGFVVVQAVLSDAGQATTRSWRRLPATSMAHAVAGQAPRARRQGARTAIDVADDAGAPAALRDEEADAWLTPRRRRLGARRARRGAAATSRPSPPRSCGRPRSLDQRGSRRHVRRGHHARVGADHRRARRGRRPADFAQGMAFALAFLFYMSSLVFGMTLAGSVVEEKQSRIVEIIATKIPVRQLLAGKVLGNTGTRGGADGPVRRDRARRAELHLVR